MAVYNFGSINIDYIYRVEHFVAPGETLASTGFQTVLGGKGANQSVACARAQCEVFHVGGIGQADASQLNVMQEAGVDISAVTLHPSTASGHAIIQVNKDAENAIILYPGANHSLSPEQIKSALTNATKDDWVLLQNETNCIADIIDIAHDAGIKVAFNPAPMTDDVKALPLDKVAILIVNEVEAMQLTGAATIDDAKAKLTADYPALTVILTLGKSGAIGMQQGELTHVSAFLVETKDTTAAGDTFIGYLLAMLHKGQSLKHAMLHASAASALAVTRVGAVPSIPQLAEVDAFLADQTN